MTHGDRLIDDPPTVDRLRHEISRGKVGDKVDHPDLAAAPLGTDDEAAGISPTPEERRMAAAIAPSDRQEKEPAVGPVIIYVAIVLAIFVVVAATLILR
jgi:hypothetical protein